MIGIPERLIRRGAESLALQEYDNESASASDAPKASRVDELLDHSPPLADLLSCVDAGSVLMSAGHGEAAMTIEQESEQEGAKEKKKEEKKATKSTVAPPPDLFQRECVSSFVSPRVGSLLAAQLGESMAGRHSRNINTNMGPGSVTGQGGVLGDLIAGGFMSVFPFPDCPPVRVRVSPGMTGKALVAKAIDMWKDDAREPHLKYDSADAYDVRMVDDDEGNPDEDMPPIDPAKDINEFACEAVAIVEKENAQNQHNHTQGPGRFTQLAEERAFRSSISLNHPSHSLSLSLASSPRVFLKVHTGTHESMILHTNKEHTLADLLAQVAKKKRVAMACEDYCFVYLDRGHGEALAMGESVGELKSDQLKLNSVRESSDANSQPPLPSVPAASVAINPDTDFQFTMDSAGTYSEYKVIKTNERGKRQTRVFGIDRYKIYNKHFRSDASSAKLAIKSAFSFAVQTADRPIASIVAVQVISNNDGRANKFSIAYKDKERIVTREYEAETNMECAEIVAKLRFLINEHKANDK